MSNIQYSYELSLEADNDLQEIYDYTAEKFGSSQAIKYLTGLEDCFMLYVLILIPDGRGMK